MLVTLPPKNGAIQEQPRMTTWHMRAAAKPQASPANDAQGSSFLEKRGRRRSYGKQRVHWRKLGAGSAVAFHWLGHGGLSLAVPLPGEEKTFPPPAGWVAGGREPGPEPQDSSLGGGLASNFHSRLKGHHLRLPWSEGRRLNSPAGPHSPPPCGEPTEMAHSSVVTGVTLESGDWVSFLTLTLLGKSHL